MRHNREKIEEIQNIIKPFHSKWKQHKDEKVSEAEINWSASMFFAKLIVKAKLPELSWSRNKLEQFTIEYNSKNHTTIDVNSLVNRYWIREVVGLIEIPDAIRKITYDFEQNQSHKQELIFIRELYSHNSSKQEINQGYYSEYLEKYKKDNQLSLEEDWIEKNWVKPKNVSDGEYKIGNIDYYFTLLDNWNDIEFLFVLKKEKSKQEPRGLAISKEDFDYIYTTHKSYFTKTPSIEELNQQEVVKEKGDEYFINFYNSKVAYWDSLSDKISGIIWENLIIDATFLEDKERIKTWLSKALYLENHWPEFYKYCTKSSKEIFFKAALELILEDKDIIGVKEEFFKCYLDENIGSRHAFQAGVDLSEEVLKPSKDYYQFYQDMHQLSDKHQNNLFYIQDVRNHLAFLIKIVIFCDKEFSNVVDGEKIITEHFPLINSSC